MKNPIELSNEAKEEIVKKCEGCKFFMVRKIRGMNPTSSLQIGECSIHGEVHSLDYSGFIVYFDSRNCPDFKKR